MNKPLHFILIVWIGIVFFSCRNSNTLNTGESPEMGTYICNAEEVQGRFFKGENIRFNGAESRSDSIAYKGKYSARANKNQPYVMTAEFRNVKKGTIIYTTVWKHSKYAIGNLVISDSLGSQFNSIKKIKRVDGEWTQLEGFFTAQRDYKLVKVYAYNNYAAPVYFDQLEITLSPSAKVPETQESLELEIPVDQMQILESFRSKAIAKGVISSKYKKYVAGSIKLNNELVPVSVRLKGDWTDHLKTDKWSLRIKIEGEAAYKGMKKFSIQSPHTRAFMLEWFAHELMMENDLLTTRYHFIPVKINGINMGVYAVEEHFDKQLLESQKRREAPIVKFNEDGIWERNELGETQNLLIPAPLFEASSIEPFKKNKTWKTETLRKNFLVAQYRMEQYRKGELPVSSYFDTDKMAKYIALSDALGTYHNQTWHNQRFYFNPVTNKLEPIGFDFHHEFNVEQASQNFDFQGKDSVKLINENLQLLFKDSSFAARYCFYLEKFTNKAYFRNFIHTKKEEIATIDALLKHEYPFYSFDSTYTLDKAERFEKNTTRICHALEKGKLKIKTPTYEKYPPGVLFESASVKAYTEKTESGICHISLKNFHFHGVKIIGFSTPENKKQIRKFSSDKKLPAYIHGKEAPGILLEIPGEVKKIFFTADNCPGKVFDVSVMKWPEPKTIQPWGNYENAQLVKNQNNEWEFTGGVFDKNVIIPDLGEKVIVPEGTRINLQKTAAFISYAPLEFRGSKNNPIKVFSSDSSSSGVVILASGKTSIYHTTFSGLNTMNKNYWNLTGAVTIYEADVEINHCRFIHNNCEDGLNLIRCHFKIENSEVSHTLSDGFDADFCTGEISRCSIHHTGNDGLDFSTSEITVSNCNLYNIGDKGVSGGENSTLSIQQTEVKNANIAFAAKDLSSVKISDSKIEGSKVGFASYRKKPEYGGANMYITGTDTSGIQQQAFLIELGSEIDYETTIYKGKTILNIDSLYAPFK